MSIQVKDGCPEKKYFVAPSIVPIPEQQRMWHSIREKVVMKETHWQSQRQLGAPGTLDSPLPVCSPWSSFSNLCPFLQGREPATGKYHKSSLQRSLALQGQEFRDFNNTTAIALNSFCKWNIWRAITVKWDLPSKKESEIKRWATHFKQWIYFCKIQNLNFSLCEFTTGNI